MMDPQSADERTLLTRVKAHALEKCKQIERKPLFRWGSIEEMRTRRYPFERDLAEYAMILKDFRPTLERLPSSARVLDIGAGRRIALAQIQQQFGLQVIGTGISRPPDIVCPFVETVASAVPFPDQAFELVISFNALSWEPEQLTAVKEINRVLKPRGAGLVYLHPFSYSVWLSFGESFWSELKVEPCDYRKHEFAPEKYSGQAGLTVVSVPLHHPSEEHRKGYYLVLRR